MAGVVRDQWVTDRFAIYNADSLDVLAKLPDESIHGSIYSPPFSGLYVYSSSDRDVSNARSYDEFAEHYGFFIDELYRLTIPGRTTAVHAAAVPSGNTGKDDYQDFPGDVIRWHQARGWQWISAHVIWKEPLAVRNRTMAKNLAHKTVVQFSEFGGVAMPDQLLVFRKPGESREPVAHPTGFTSGYAGGERIPGELLRFRGMEGDQKLNRYSHWIWRRYASSVWDDVRIERVHANPRAARAHGWIIPALRVGLDPEVVPMLTHAHGWLQLNDRGTSTRMREAEALELLFLYGMREVA